MKVLFKPELLVLIPEREEESSNLTDWKTGREDHVLAVTINRGSGFSLGDLGPRERACNIPLNVTSRSSDPACQLISNFATAPFTLDHQDYQTVEGFWQGLKFSSHADRRRIAELPGATACREGRKQEYGDTIKYQGRAIRVGTWDHWELMREACWAKFTQNEPAREALLSTGDRPLQHRVRRDSKTIPGALMADVWMRIRRQLRNLSETEDEQLEEEG